jgi:hypothetical protein
MSQTILSGSFTVYFTNDTGGDKQIRSNNSVVWSVREFYAALMDLFDNNTAGVGDYMDEGVPMSASTPTVYEIGIIENNDKEPWFIDPETIKHLKGGSIATTGWTRTVGTATGVVKITYTLGTDFSASDLGKTVVSSAGDSGTLLYYDGSIAWIRPDSSAAANNFDSGTVTVTAGSAASVTITAVNDGESLWSNIYTLGTLQENTTLYVAQNNVEIPNWWYDGHFDILVPVIEQDVLVDEGLVTVYARQPTKLYDNYVVDASQGGRNAVPLSTSKDVNDVDGHKTIAVASASQAFTVGGLVSGATSLTQAICTVNTGNPSTAFQYYLIGDGVTDFINGEGLTDYATLTPNGTASGTSSGINGSTYTDVTVTFGLNSTFDINGDTVNEKYAIVIDCNGRPLSEVYKRLKYITRHAETATLNGIEGQQYIGIDYRITYQALTGTISTGDTVSQETGAGTGIFTYGEVVAHDTASKNLIIRDTRGAIGWYAGLGAESIVVDGSNYVTMESFGDVILQISPSKVSPFGTLAGGRFFGAWGVVLDNVASADINNYEVTAIDGVTYAEPIQVATVITVVDASTQLPIENARVILGAADGTGDLDYQTSVTITRVSATATVAHTAHPYIIGSKVNIVGADQQEYNGVKTITAIAANSYDFTVSGTPTTPATGTITSTGLILEGLTNANGQISDTRAISVDQPIIGRARKSTTSPLYKTSAISGVLDSVTGYSQTVSLIRDD